MPSRRITRGHGSHRFGRDRRPLRRSRRPSLRNQSQAPLRQRRGHRA
ncbi:unnamed protein product, partial [Rotaria sp. Silwood2]